MDGIIREGRIYRLDRQGADGWHVWHVAHWHGEEREFTTYEAAYRWLQQRKAHLVYIHGEAQ